MTVRRAAAVVLLAGGLLTLLPSAARAADDPTTTTTAPTEAPATTLPAATDTGRSTGVDLVPPGSGFDGLLPPSMLRPNGDQPTLLEATDQAAYRWDGKYGRFDTDGIVAMVTDLLMSGIAWIGTGVTRLVSWVFQIPSVDGDPITRLVNQLRDNLFFTWSAIAVLAIAVWALILAARARTLEAVSHIGWTIVVGTMSVAIMAVPGTIIEQVNRGVSHFARLNMAAASQLDPKLDVADGTVTRGTFSGDPAVSAVRRTTDLWWRMYVVQPWAVGEFGRTTDPLPAGTIDRTLLLKSGAMIEGALTPEEVDALSGAVKIECVLKDPDSVVAKLLGGPRKLATKWEAVLCMRQQAWESLRDETAKIPGVAPWLNGDKQTERLWIGIGGLLAALTTGAVLAGLAILTQWYLLKGTLMLMVIGPAGLLGIVPDMSGNGRAGPQAYLQLWSELVWTYLRVIIFATAMGVVLVGMAVFGSASSTKGWAWSVFVHIAVLVVLAVVWVKRRHAQGRSALPHPIRQARASIASARASMAAGTARIGRGMTRAHVLANSLRYDGELLNARAPKQQDRRVGTRPRRQPSEDRSHLWASWDDPVHGPEHPGPHDAIGTTRPIGALGPAPVVRAHGPAARPQPIAIGRTRVTAALPAGPTVRTAGPVPVEREAIALPAAHEDTGADRVQGRFPDRRVIDTVGRRV